MAKKRLSKGRVKGGRTARKSVARRSPARRTAAKRAAPRKQAAPRKRAAPAKQAARAAAPARPMDPHAMMAAWETSKTPGEGHRRLDPLVGSWVARVTFTMVPDSPPEVSEGFSENRWILGGRYLEQTYSGSAMGMPMEGRGYTGFDNVQGRYIGTWMDSFGTGIMHSMGAGAATDEAIDFESEMVEPGGTRRPCWSTVRIKDQDNHSFEMWTRSDDGRRYRTMLVEYRRR